MVTWREKCSPIIYQVIKDNPGKSVEELKKLSSVEYPFGARKYHPYKIWLDEVKRQLGLKRNKREHIDKNQLNLF